MKLEDGNNTVKELRLCSFCNLKKNGDEYHTLFTCTNDRIVQLRQKHILNYYWNPSVMHKMEGLFRLCNSQLVTNITRFIKIFHNYYTYLLYIIKWEVMICQFSYHTHITPILAKGLILSSRVDMGCDMKIDIFITYLSYTSNSIESHKK